MPICSPHLCPDSSITPDGGSTLLRNSATYFSWQIPYLAHQSSFHASSWDPWLPSEIHQGCRNLSLSFCFPVGRLQETANEEMYADITLMQSWNWSRGATPAVSRAQEKSCVDCNTLDQICGLMLNNSFIITQEGAYFCQCICFSYLRMRHVYRVQQGHHLYLYPSALSLLKCPPDLPLNLLNRVASYSTLQLHKKHYCTTPGLPEFLFCHNT